MKKEQNILELFFEQPSKQWHFEEILRSAKISRPQALNWLKIFIDEHIIKRIKPRGKMPHYIANFEHPAYDNKKRIYALDILYKAGLLNHLQSLPHAKTAIIFGSFARSDWHAGSDIDIFIYGSDEEFDKGKFESILKREIQIFTADNKKELNHLGTDLLHNIINGHIVKGNLDFIEVRINES